MPDRKWLKFTLAALLLVAAGAEAREAYTAVDTALFAGPDDDYPLVAEVDAGYPLEVYGCTGGYTWCDVGLDDNRGWIDGRDIEFAEDAERLPVYRYGPRFRVPIISFTIGSYWDRWYLRRPFYSERPHWLRHAPPRAYWDRDEGREHEHIHDWDHDHDNHQDRDHGQAHDADRARHDDDHGRPDHDRHQDHERNRGGVEQPQRVIDRDPAPRPPRSDDDRQRMRQWQLQHLQRDQQHDQPRQPPQASEPAQRPAQNQPPPAQHKPIVPKHQSAPPDEPHRNTRGEVR